jgi:PhoPQ-activated pathogenicity-related protein
MTKAAVKALDVMQAVLPILTKNAAAGSQFVVAGASKRGWTTWLTGVVDPRVVAIVPIVLDALDMRAFLHRQFRMYGGYSFALQPYVELNITQEIDSPAVHDLFTIIDPIFYADRLTMPKLMVSAGGDEFQMPDDQRYWRSQMVGEMNFLVVKNAEHSEITGIFEILPAVGAFVESIVAHRPRPTMQWKIDDATGNITMVTDTVPKSVTIAVADSAGDVSTGKRDFRWAALNVSFCPIKVFGGCVRPILWGTYPLAASTPDQLTYVAGVPLPAAPAYRAFMIEVKWANPSGGDDFEFTTGVSVVPNTFPFADCTTPAQCRGTLL